MRRTWLGVAFCLLVIPVSHAQSSCGDVSCKEAEAVVRQYIDAQAAYQEYDYKTWLPLTDLEQAPAWRDVTVFKTAIINAVTCANQDQCTVAVTYDVIGTHVPLQTFHPRRESESVTYALSRRMGRLLISGPLPAKFVDAQTCIRFTSGMTTDSLAFRNIYDGLARQIGEAAE